MSETTEARQAQATGFDEIWVETVREVHARLAETEFIRYTRPDHVTVWVTAVVLKILMPLNSIRNLTVCGITEGGEPVADDFWEGTDDYPEEVAPLVLALLKIGQPVSGPGKEN